VPLTSLKPTLKPPGPAPCRWRGPDSLPPPKRARAAPRQRLNQPGHGDSGHRGQREGGRGVPLTSLKPTLKPPGPAPFFFGGSIFTDQDPITGHDPAILRCRTDLTSRSPRGAVVHGSTEGRGPVPSVHPLCKPLHRPLSHLDLPSALISALVHRGE